MSLFIFPKAFDMGFFEKESHPPPKGQEGSESTQVETHPVVSEVNLDPNTLQMVRSMLGQRNDYATSPFMNKDKSIQY